MSEDQEYLERRIVTGLIVSTEYTKRIARSLRPELLESSELALIARWCFKYFDTYHVAPDKDIQAIFIDEARSNAVPKETLEYIEQLLTSLSDEYGRGDMFNAGYLYDQTIRYLKVQELVIHTRQVEALTSQGRVDEAEKLAKAFTSQVVREEEVGLELSSAKALDAIDRAFNVVYSPVVSYPGALGSMWNEHLVRGGFFTLLAPEKRGKSFFLMDLAFRAIRHRANVALFEAGDMTEEQILRRLCIYLTQRSDRPRYCAERFRPVGDCIMNQIDECDRPDRNCDHGVFKAMSRAAYIAQMNELLTLDSLVKLWGEAPNYKPCDSHTCPVRNGTVWLKKVPKVKLLNAEDAKKSLTAFFRRYKRRFKLMSSPAGTLTVTGMREILDQWERQDGFVPDLVIVDYADLLSADDSTITEFRHRQDHVWKSLRALSQQRHVLVASATQADAASYNQGRLSRGNFSEDKRKLAHVTAQYGLNQDPKGREAELGIMRVNEIVVREGATSADKDVFVLQDLASGRAYIESFTVRPIWRDDDGTPQ